METEDNLLDFDEELFVTIIKFSYLYRELTINLVY